MFVLFSSPSWALSLPSSPEASQEAPEKPAEDIHSLEKGVGMLEQGTDGVTIPGSVQNPCGCGTWAHAERAGTAGVMDFLILKFFFSSIKNSVPLWLPAQLHSVILSTPQTPWSSKLAV